MAGQMVGREILAYIGIGDNRGHYTGVFYEDSRTPDSPRLATERRMQENGKAHLREFRMRDGETALVEYHTVDYPAGFEIIRCVKRDDRTEAQVAEDLKGRKK